MWEKGAYRGYGSGRRGPKDRGRDAGFTGVINSDQLPYFTGGGGDGRGCWSQPSAPSPPPATITHRLVSNIAIPPGFFVEKIPMFNYREHDDDPCSV
jgi:hypothetical protein